MNTKGIYRQKVWVYMGQHELVVERHMLTRFSKHLWARIREVAYGPENTTRILADRLTAQKCQTSCEADASIRMMISGDIFSSCQKQAWQRFEVGRQED